MTIITPSRPTIEALVAFTRRGRTGRMATALLGCLLASEAIPASAQIKPASSGEPSFQEPEMRPHGSGFFRPNKPHRRFGRSAYHSRQTSPNL